MKKKLVLSLGTALAVIAPVISTVACDPTESNVNLVMDQIKPIADKDGYISSSKTFHEINAVPLTGNFTAAVASSLGITVKVPALAGTTLTYELSIPQRASTDKAKFEITITCKKANVPTESKTFELISSNTVSDLLLVQTQAIVAQEKIKTTLGASGATLATSKATIEHTAVGTLTTLTNAELSALGLSGKLPNLESENLEFKYKTSLPADAEKITLSVVLAKKGTLAGVLDEYFTNTYTILTKQADVNRANASIAKAEHHVKGGHIDSKHTKTIAQLNVAITSGAEALAKEILIIENDKGHEKTFDDTKDDHSKPFFDENTTISWTLANHTTVFDKYLLTATIGHSTKNATAKKVEFIVQPSDYNHEAAQEETADLVAAKNELQSFFMNGADSTAANFSDVKFNTTIADADFTLATLTTLEIATPSGLVLKPGITYKFGIIKNSDTSLTLTIKMSKTNGTTQTLVLAVK